MTIRTTPTGNRAHSAIEVAVRLSLLWQAAFSVAMLVRYRNHGTSFYLPQIDGAWPYVHQHLLWIAAFVALGLGGRRLGGVLAIAAAFLAAVEVVTLAAGGGPLEAVLSAVGVACVGVLPALALVLLPGARLAQLRRPIWLGAGAIAGMVLSMCSDGVRGGPSGLLMVGPPQQTSVLRMLWLLWVACILFLAWRGLQRTALVSTGHLLVVQVLLLAGDMAIRSRMLGLPASLPLEGLLRSAILVAVLLALHRSAKALAAPPAAGLPASRAPGGLKDDLS